MDATDEWNRINEQLDREADLGWPEEQTEEMEMPEINVPPREDLPKFINQKELRKVLGEGGKFRIAGPSSESQFGHNFPIELPNGETRTFTIKAQKLAPFVAAWGNNTDKWVDRFVVYKDDYINPQFPQNKSMNLIPEKEQEDK